MSSGVRLLLRCDVNAGIPSSSKQGKGPSSRDEEGEPGLFLGCGVLSVFLSKADGMYWNFLSCLNGVKDFFEAQVGSWDFSRDASAEKGLSMWRGESPFFFQVVAGFLSSNDGDLRNPLLGPQGSPFSTRVMRGPSGFLCSRCQCRGPHLELRPEPHVSPTGPTWTSGFLWGIHRGVRPHLVWSQASLLST